ncbi:sigma-54 interaction domain-containing protein [Virgibacillus sediminis]|uniref:Sigma-54 interaction domain-containing protein n=1 Tax=Virgibacillus sediminis TaxID=202260 RepID=A0ABV7A4U6_9BACI
MVNNKGLYNSLEYYKELSKDLEAILNSVYDVIYVSDYKGKTLRVSQSCERLWGKSEDELIGRDVYDLEKENVYSPSITRLVLERNDKVRSIQSTKTGRKLMAIGTPIRNKKGEIVRIINAARDVTEITQLQKEIDEMQQLIEGYRSELKEYKMEDFKHSKIIAKSPGMKQVIKLSDRISKVDSTVLVYGESGVGKEVVSNYIHENSYRTNKPFVKVNCGAIPESLLESELFGYEPGAFTGADKSGKIGLFEQANGGTILLDEIGEMSQAIQVKFLRVLQEREVTRIGGKKTIPIDVRIIATTNKNLSREVAEGNFREDLYYRLNVIPIFIPPLRERREDINDLVYLFLDFYNNKYTRKVTISDTAINNLIEYRFPGNIRELQNIIERIVVINDDSIIESIIDTVGVSSEFKEKTLNKNDVIIQNILPYKKCMEEAEKQLLKTVFNKYKKLTEVAEVLKIDPSTVSRKLNKHFPKGLE